MTDVADTFTRANSADLGTNWTTQTGTAAMRIVTNRALNIGTGVFSAEYWNANTFSDDQYAEGVATTELETSTGAPDLGIGPAIWMSTTNERKIAAIISGDPARDLQLVEWDSAGTPTVRGTYTAGTPAVGDKVRIEGEAATATARVYLNDILRITYAGAALTTGRIGLCGRQDSNACAIDNFAGGDLITVSAVLGGDILTATTEADIVAGGKTITLTLTGTTWVP